MRIPITSKAGSLFLLLAISLYSCRKEGDSIVSPTITPVSQPDTGSIKGFFLLNEANMGSNKSSLDYFDYESGTYSKNIFPIRNPGVVKELGDVGNDIQIYGGKLYAVINASHLVEVMDLQTAKHISTIVIPNCRYIRFYKGNAYISSYAGPVTMDPRARLGYIARVDTLTLTVKDTCVTGYQPEEMVIRDNKLYVANSGGYRAPNYDNTVSVIDLTTFKEIRKITAGINMHRMVLDNYGNIYVSSRGDYDTIHSKTYIINAADLVSELPELPAGNMVISGDSLYICHSEWNSTTNSTTIAYTIFNTRLKNIETRNFIKDGTDAKILIPYGLAINPDTKEIYITDARDYVSPGRLYCYTPEGRYKWDVETGDIPAHITFTRKKLSKL